MINELINEIKNKKYIFINSDAFKGDVLKNIKYLFPLLNSDDIEILYHLTLYMIEDISIRYNFPKNIGYKQWTKNDGQDITSLCITLIPFIGDNNYDIITKLTDIIYKGSEDKIPADLLNYERNIILKKHFPYSNMTLGLLNVTDNHILDLYETKQHTIYHCIENNFLSMLETIKITNGKLFVNWLNVIPVIDYTNEKIYTESMKTINKLKTNFLDMDEMLTTLRDDKGLWFGDYYNVLSNGYFNSVRKVKWFIFCSKINESYYYNIQYLNKILNFKLIFENHDYNSMTNYEKMIFDEMINNWFNRLSNNLPIFLDIDFEFDLIKNIICFMSTNYTKKNLLNEVFSKYQLLNDIDIDESGIDIDPIYEKIKKIGNTQILFLLKDIKPEYIWEYLKESIIIFESTPYSNYLIKNNTIVMNFFNVVDTENKKINLKNIYNIAKLLCHDLINDMFVYLGSQFKSLDQTYVQRFIYAYLSGDFSWLNIRKNIKYQEKDNYNYNTIINNITNAWEDIKIKLVWDYLHHNGIISHFNINFQLTDNSTIMASDNNSKNKEKQQRLKIFLEKNKKLLDMNYFMTNEPYNELKEYINAGIDKYDKLLVNQLMFYTFYANDWISQLNFFNHFINHNVLYVTGSTGTGKSTQVPKLTMYCLKMYDYKTTCKVICTQPRIAPTQDNAEQIAKEMGLHIMYTDKITRNKIKTNDYYIMYKHAKDEHTKKYLNHPSLKIVTDGTLLEELVNNPLLKIQIKDKKKFDRQTYSVANTNTYDVVMVDEAHEHNANMDVILTLMRQSCIYNNSIRLIIISATMDDDEMIYRSYYKLINDNIVHPIKMPIFKHPIINSENLLIDAHYLDRRIHISIPKKAYSYPIKEIYDENIEKEFTDDMKKNYIISQNKAYDIIQKEICNKTVFGDILLFSVGKEEIKDAVIQLNKITPGNFIALPFYGEMNSRYREIISKIGDNISKIRNKKANITEEWAESYMEVKDVPENTYTRAIIVATNVAEASITINSLRYVVDTGYAKVSRYDIKNDTVSINIEHISESSRIQRKGRVGRVAEGTVYYIYGKNKRLDVKPKYGITLTDFQLTYLKLTTMGELETSTLSYIWDDYLMPYSSKYEMDYIQIGSLNKSDISISKLNIIESIIKPQFYISIYSIPREYFYNFNEYKDLPAYLNRKLDGYLKEEVDDTMGNFYIIHPFENKLTRNIMNNIIMYNKKNQNKIDDKEYNIFIRRMEDKLYYVPFKYNFNIITGNTITMTNEEGKETVLSENDINKYNEYFYIKTEYYEKINKLLVYLKNMEEKDIIILFMASGFDILYEACEVLTLLSTCNNSILSLATDNKMMDIFNSDSDITSIYNICKLIKDKFKHLLVYSTYNNKLILNKFKIEYNNIVKLYRSKKYNEIMDSLNCMNYLFYNGFLDDDKGFLYWLKLSSKFQKELKNDIKKEEKNIINFCEKYYLNSKIIIDYLYNMIPLLTTIYTSDTEFIKEFDEINPLEFAKKLQPRLSKLLKYNTIQEKLNICFIFGKPLQFSFNYNNSYYNMNANKCSINPYKKNQLNTLVLNPGKYLSYYRINNDNISIIFNVDIDQLYKIYPTFYNAINMNKMINFKDVPASIYLLNKAGNMNMRLIFNQHVLGITDFIILNNYINELLDIYKN